MCPFLKESESASCSAMSDSLRPQGLYSPRNSPGQNTGVGSHSFLQGIFPTQGSSPGLPHCRQILCQLSHQGSPRILEWVPIPFPGDLPNLGIKLGSPALRVDSLPAELPGKPILGKLLSDFTFTFHFPALEKDMATHSSVLAWRIPGTAEPGGLPSMGSHRVRHD